MSDDVSGGGSDAGRDDGLFAGGRGRVLVFCWLGWVFDFYDLILFAFLQHRIAAELAIDDGGLAWIVGATLAMTAVGGFAFGRIADRVGRRTALTWSILIYSAGAFATAFADSYGALLAARLVTGFGVGGEWGVGHAVVAETYPPRLRNRAAAVLQAGSPVAMAMAAAVGCFLGPEIGWRKCFWLSAIPALLVVAARWAMPGPDRAPARESRVRDASAIRLLFGDPRTRRASFAILGLLTLHMTGFWCTYAWLPKTLIREAGATLAFVGWFQIAVNAVHVFADVGFGFVADRVGRARAFRGCCILFAAGLASIALGFGVLTEDLVLFTFVIAAVGLGAGTWSCFGVLFAVNYPAEVRATAASGFYNLSRGVQLVTQPTLIMLVAHFDTFAVALWIGAATAIASAFLIGAVPRVEDTESSGFGRG